MATDEVMSMIRIRAAGVMAVAVLVMTACGGSDDTATDTSAPAADEQSFAGGDTVDADDAASDDASDDASDGGSDGADISAAAIRSALIESADDAELDIESMPAGDLDCMVEQIAADPSLAAQVLADDVSDDGAMVGIFAECSPETVLSLLSDDPTFAAMSDDEALCMVSVFADDPELMDAVIDDPAALMSEMFACAPDAMAASLADDTGLGVDEAACLLGEMDGGGVLASIGLGDPSMTEDEMMAGMGELFTAFATCGISMDELGDLGDFGDDVDSGGAASGTPEEIAAARDSCAAGDMAACDELWWMSPYGSDDEEFGATCGGTADSSQAGMCTIDIDELASDCANDDLVACDLLYAMSPDDPDLVELAATCGGTADGETPGMCASSTIALEEFRAGCAAGDMASCDLLYFASGIGTDDEEFGATCGGLTDGSTAGTCEESA
ncbi:MAG: hypothetical protein EBS20_10815 [Actinobacteria bacterium]|nr:hypothetical protein [Actinomycetota bacterium]